MKKHKGSKEQERYYARKNREMDRYEAHSKSSVYAEKAASEFTEREGVSLGVDPLEGLESGVSCMADVLGNALVSMEMPFGELKEIIQRAWLKGLDKGREQGGLEPLFRGEEA
ncbi:hypothetical protein EXB91_24845 [Salmonella enterica subsp. enterica serovar Florida]|uniref:Uncharacterized protein n=3 Tax=Salmonella enterica I TaxID=59201 RepID=A0A5U8JGB7_SALET|nr:hypothetical protein [Salmonella enterica]EBR7996918.1 hypothetical protein [Salmonella enterica subsp. enterica serovar Panama]EBS4088763.1 hypothetical protein [Salmonella enterica subsp. enterica serovar Newport]ECG3786853.1 hypothetical protein [Salmonella enterica subsp. enterica serovar Florida]ASD87229.1 hypothetical protein LFZ16_13880 [Salmonella enterica subsp. enterica serovar India str. SA20085604]EBR8436495.1 hypothetical protein [Salmonella enterica subsp. enterica serovar Pan